MVVSFHSSGEKKFQKPMCVLFNEAKQKVCFQCRFSIKIEKRYDTALIGNVCVSSSHRDGGKKRRVKTKKARWNFPKMW